MDIMSSSNMNPVVQSSVDSQTGVNYSNMLGKSTFNYNWRDLVEDIKSMFGLSDSADPSHIHTPGGLFGELGDLDAGEVKEPKTDKKKDKSIPDDGLFNIDVEGWLNEISKFLDKQYAFNQASAERSMKFEEEQSEKERQWSEYMQNTYFKRMMKSAQDAGLNPLLVFESLSGVPAPSGSIARGSSASGSYGSPTSILSAFVSMMASNKQLLGQFLRMIGSLFSIGSSVSDVSISKR